MSTDITALLAEAERLEREYANPPDGRTATKVALRADRVKFWGTHAPTILARVRELEAERAHFQSAAEAITTIVGDRDLLKAEVVCLKDASHKTDNERQRLAVMLESAKEEVTRLTDLLNCMPKNPCATQEGDLDDARREVARLTARWAKFRERLKDVILASVVSDSFDVAKAVADAMDELEAQR